MSLQLRKRIKMTMAGLTARGLQRPKLTPGELTAMAPQRILVVRQHNQMGDMVCATPALRAIRDTFPGARIALICAPLNWEVVRHNPDLDQVLVFDKKTWTQPLRFWKFLRSLRGFRADLAVVLNSVSFSLTSTGLAVISGARTIVGGDSLPFGWDISRHVYSLEMPTRPHPDCHAVEHGLAPLAAVGITSDDNSTRVGVTLAERRRASEILADLESQEPPWVLHPGAGKQENLWLAERFAAMAARAAAAGHAVLVLQGPADQSVMGKFWAAMAAFPDNQDGQRVMGAPPLPVTVCTALLEKADRFLCNDTGLMHVAGAVGVPTLALFGPTDPEIWKPMVDSVVGLRAPQGRLADLDEEEVWRVWSGLRTDQARSS